MQAKPRPVAAQPHLQLLYAGALEFLDQPFPPEEAAYAAGQGQACEPERAGDAGQAPASPPQQQDDDESQLRELLGLGSNEAAEEQSAQQPAALPAAQSAAVYVVYALWSAQPLPTAAAGSSPLAARPLEPAAAAGVPE